MMLPRKSHPMEYASRLGRQQADQAIKRDVMRAVIELITNADDSYRRLESKGEKVNGGIYVKILRKREVSEIGVFDRAEGLDSNRLDKVLGHYGEDVSGFSGGEPVRGFFGRGLKDAILGVGEGVIRSIVQGQLHTARLTIKDGRPWYDEDEPVKASPEWRSMLDIEKENGTVVYLRLNREDVRMPQLDTFRNTLSLHFSLRDILSSPKRKVFLQSFDIRGNLRFNTQLIYKFPKGDFVLDKDVPLSPEWGMVSLKILKSLEVLDQPSETGVVAQAGILLCSQNAIYDNKLLKFEGNPAASRFFGRATCSKLDILLKTDDSIVQATRDGLDFSHSFSKALKKAIEDELSPLVEKEAMREQENRQTIQDNKLRSKLDRLVKEINKIAQEELHIGDVREGTSLRIPEGGFGFIPDAFNVELGNPRTITVRATSPVPLSENSRIALSSNIREISVSPSEVMLTPRKDNTSIIEARLEIEGHQIGAEGWITAKFEALENQALVHVIAKFKERPIHPQKLGLFNDIVPDNRQNPLFRVRYDSESHNVVFYTQSPSVKRYIGHSGSLNESPQGQVLLAELVTEAITKEIARRGVESRKYASPTGGEAERVDSMRITLQNKYASLIHQLLVD